jgi:hypothetical protein
MRGTYLAGVEVIRPRDLCVFEQIFMSVSRNRRVEHWWKARLRREDGFGMRSNGGNGQEEWLLCIGCVLQKID